MTPITQNDVERLHAACKMIEADGVFAYWTCRERFGENVANAVLVCWLRNNLNDKPGQYPSPENLPDKVNKVLVESRLMKHDLER